MPAKYYIVSKNINAGVRGDDSNNLSTYFELGWELAITRIYLNLLLKRKEFDADKDFVVTNFDRGFLYSKYCKNVITYADFLKNNIDQSCVVDLTDNEAKIAVNNIFLGDMLNYIPEVLENELNKEIDLKDPLDIVKDDKQFICMVVRKRDHCPYRSMSELDVEKIINFYLNKNINVYIMGKNCESYDNGKNVFHVGYREFASLINSDKCLKMITPTSGGGMIRFYTGNCPIDVVDVAGESRRDHVLLYGENADFTGMRNKNLFNLVRLVDEVLEENFKTKINAISTENYIGDKGSSFNNPIRSFEWVRDGSGDASIFIDSMIPQVINSPLKNKFCWLLESRSVIPDIFNFVENNREELLKHCVVIFTCDENLAKLDGFAYVPSNAGSWVEDRKVHEKTKLISMISSYKTISSGHAKRMEYVEKFKNDLDFYGRDANPISKKEDGLRDYMFSIAIENCEYDTYFTEKISDCFATGTIPVYLGTKNIGKYFNEDGIVILDENFSIDKLSKELYYSKMDAIRENFEKVNNLITPEDYIYENYLKGIL